MGRPRNALAQALKRTQKAAVGLGLGHKHGAVGQGPATEKEEQVDSGNELAGGSGLEGMKEFGNLEDKI